MATVVPINELRHPSLNVEEWIKWRLAYTGGRAFINRYLKTFSRREDSSEYEIRKQITYCPRFAGAAIDDIRNSITERLPDVVRKDGSLSYQQSVRGEGSGIDLMGNSMNSFMATHIIPELLVMGRVGIFIDMPPLVNNPSLNDLAGKKPYVYWYPTEAIRSWTYGDDIYDFTSLLLEDRVEKLDPNTGFPSGWETQFRKLWKQDGKIYVQMYLPGDKETYVPQEEIIELNIPKIPFVFLSLNTPLMEDIADYQIALLNLVSSDMSYLIKSNFPFYVEQYDTRSDNQFGKQPGSNDPGMKGYPEQKGKEIQVGATRGRQYPLGADAPAFIHPSPEPMEVSMKKQEQIKQEIRQLLNLSIANITKPGLASAESKQADQTSLETGLSFIGMRLEIAERQVAQIWEEYERTGDTATIHYPETYNAKDDGQRRTEAKEIINLGESIPSITYRKEMAKRASHVLLCSKVSHETIVAIDKELDDAEVIIFDPANLILDVENGLIDLERASAARLYPEGSVDDGKVDHAERLARISVAQGGNDSSPAARGAAILGADNRAGKIEKKVSLDTTNDPVVTNKQRGEGK